MNRKRILVPIDLEDESESALNFVRSISKRLNAMISCMYVFEEQQFTSTKHASGYASQRQRRNADYRLSERVIYILEEAQTPFKINIASGGLRKKILAKSRDLMLLSSTVKVF